VKRREVITLLSSTAAAWPLAARAQQPKMPVVGWLYAGAPAAIAHLMPGFRQGLNGTGFIEGQNVTIEYRFAEGQYDRLPNLVADLIRRQVTVIVTPGSPVAALTVKDANRTIPIVFSIGPLVCPGLPDLGHSTRRDEADAGIKFSRRPLDLGDNPPRLGPGSGLIAEIGMEPTHMVRRSSDWAREQIADQRSATIVLRRLLDRHRFARTRVWKANRCRRSIIHFNSP
jgi:hypothetical protein